MIRIHEDELACLLAVARLYLECLDIDPENETLTLVEAFAVTELRDVVAKYDPHT